MSKFEVTKKDLRNYQTFNDEDYRTVDDDDYSDDKVTNFTTRTWRDTTHLQFDNNRRNGSLIQQQLRNKRKYLGNKLKRIEQLAQPKIRVNSYALHDHPPFRVRASALNYNATDRLSDLAMPKRIHTKIPTKTSSICLTDPNLSMKKTSQYIISDRLEFLSQPKRWPQSDGTDQKDGPMARFHHPIDIMKMNRLTRLVELTRLPKHKLMQIPEKKPGAVSYSALVCRPSPRIEELAGPKVRRNPKMNEFAFSIKPAALKYTPTSRINNLAIARARLTLIRDSME